ncbi:uncharacterized protein LOC125945518 isoform X2 [Dermacentor silvarum]|uniref:uncharacterized protein LOC125945518 isoform X2 n=1 Tax=Dermacentor silvarum TaxID=543639 RepID=UPI00210083C4|nr:uncharacterized protein LOC125945518 isoform X2 [Dermacentor silvarum]
MLRVSPKHHTTMTGVTIPGMILGIILTGSCVVNGTAVDYGRDFALEWPCEEWNCSGAINETHAMLRRKTCRKPDPPNRYCRIKKDRGRFSRCCPRRVCHLEGWPDEEYE